MGLAQENVRELWLNYNSQRSEELRNALVLHYLSLTRYTAERIWARLPNEVDLEDLVNAGIFGLMDAIKAFDLNRGVKFETYCIPRIRGAILDELRSLDWVPRLVRLRAHKLRRAYKGLKDKLGKEPTEEELAREMGIPLEEYLDLAKETATCIFISMDKECFEGDNSKALKEADIIQDKKQKNPTLKIQRQDLRELVTKGLSKKERLIILLYYYEEMTMREIGMVLNISESRVSQMHASILTRLQAHLLNRKGEFVSA